MKIQPKHFKRAALSLCAATFLSASAALALPEASWDSLDVLVAGVTSVDYLNGKRAPNGFLRARLLQGHADYLMTVFEWTYELSMTKDERDEFTRRLAGAWAGAENKSPSRCICSARTGSNRRARKRLSAGLGCRRQEKQIAIASLQNQAQMNQAMVTSMHNMNVQNHATNINIIENMRPVPQYHYSVK